MGWITNPATHQRTNEARGNPGSFFVAGAGHPANMIFAANSDLPCVHRNLDPKLMVMKSTEDMYGTALAVP